MRLICPNCGAQYEVADNVIPVAGRDVQCSNCGHTWFERPGASEAAEAGEPLLAPVPQAAPTPDPFSEPGPEVAQPTEPTTIAEIPAEPEPAPQPAPAFDPVAMAAAAGLPRSGLSADLAEMLREEAAREAAARAAETAARPVETMAKAPLPDNQHRDGVSDRVAGLQAEVSPKTVSPANRRELLPDIEKINSSLRPATEFGTMDTAAEPVVQARKRGARFGFTTVMLIVAILVGLYLGAPKISTFVPAAEPVLTRYVAVVDDIRLWIDLKMQAFIADQSVPAPAADETPAAPATDTPATEAPATQAPAAEPPAADSQSAPAIDTAPTAPLVPETDQSSG